MATADIRNSVSFAVMNKYMVPLTQPALILNVDATQFTVGEKHGTNNVKYVESSKNSLKVLPKSTSDSSVSYFIKYFLLIAADGSAADPVYVIADGNMSMR